MIWPAPNIAAWVWELFRFDDERKVVRPLQDPMGVPVDWRTVETRSEHWEVPLLILDANDKFEDYLSIDRPDKAVEDGSWEGRLLAIDAHEEHAVSADVLRRMARLVYELFPPEPPLTGVLILSQQKNDVKFEWPAFVDLDLAGREMPTEAEVRELETLGRELNRVESRQYEPTTELRKQFTEKAEKLIRKLFCREEITKASPRSRYAEANWWVKWPGEDRYTLDIHIQVEVLGNRPLVIELSDGGANNVARNIRSFEGIWKALRDGCWVWSLFPADQIEQFERDRLPFRGQVVEETAETFRLLGEAGPWLWRQRDMIEWLRASGRLPENL